MNSSSSLVIPLADNIGAPIIAVSLSITIQSLSNIPSDVFAAFDVIVNCDTLPVFWINVESTFSIIFCPGIIFSNGGVDTICLDVVSEVTIVGMIAVKSLSDGKECVGIWILFWNVVPVIPGAVFVWTFKFTCLAIELAIPDILFLPTAIISGKSLLLLSVVCVVFTIVVANPCSVTRLAVFSIGEVVVIIGLEFDTTIVFANIINWMLGFASALTDNDVLFVVTTYVGGGVNISTT